MARFIAPKGSVALDGVSLTVNAVEGDTFSVLIIPHTLAVTTFGALRKGDDVNLEVDTMARYAARLMEQRLDGLVPARRPCYHAAQQGTGSMAKRLKKQRRTKKARQPAHPDRGSALLRAYRRRAAAGANRVLDEAVRNHDRITRARRARDSRRRSPWRSMLLHASARPMTAWWRSAASFQGETYHFEMVSNESARGLMDLSVDAANSARQRHSHRRQRGAGDGRAAEAQPATRARSAARAALAMVALKRRLAGK